MTELHTIKLRILVVNIWGKMADVKLHHKAKVKPTAAIISLYVKKKYMFTQGSWLTVLHAWWILQMPCKLSIGMN